MSSVLLNVFCWSGSQFLFFSPENKLNSSLKFSESNLSDKRISQAAWVHLQIYEWSVHLNHITDLKNLLLVIKILCFQFVKNKFARDGDNQKTILVELEDEVIFLPQYFMDALDNDDIDNLNSFDEIHYLYFGGQREENK